MNTTHLAAGKPIHCLHCGQGEFESRKILLNTRGATFFNFDWLNRRATALTCARCGRIDWFATEPQEVK
jgi:predicted nucleic-acid-binding Zn-ribbon protein